MFDKKQYWKRRNNMGTVEVPGKKGKMMKVMVPMPLRGQLEITPKIIPKGETVFFINSKGEKKEYPNALGQHRRFDRKGKIIVLNRTEARKKFVYRGFTRPGSKDHVYKPEKDPKNEAFVHPTPEYAPNLTNNQRMKLRAIRRMDLKNASPSKAIA